MRFNSNKKVVINKKEAQVRNHGLIKISGKRKRRAVHGFYKGIAVYIVAFKRKEKNGKIKLVYLVTSEKKPRKKRSKRTKKDGILKNSFVQANNTWDSAIVKLSVRPNKKHIFLPFLSSMLGFKFKNLIEKQKIRNKFYTKFGSKKLEI